MPTPQRYPVSRMNALSFGDHFAIAVTIASGFHLRTLADLFRKKTRKFGDNAGMRKIQNIAYLQNVLGALLLYKVTAVAFQRRRCTFEVQLNNVPARISETTPKCRWKHHVVSAMKLIPGIKYVQTLKYSFAILQGKYMHVCVNTT